MDCPYCGKAMERGWLLCGMPAVWSKRPKKTLAVMMLTRDFLSAEADIRLLPDETGHPMVWRCGACHKMIFDGNDESTVK